MSKVHDLISHERKKRGLPHVYWSRQMARLAQSQANHCAKVGRLVHSNNLPPGSAENLAQGGRYFSPRAIVNTWLNSKAGHRENLLNPQARKAGVGIAKARGKTFVAWVSSNLAPSYPDCLFYKPHRPFWRKALNAQSPWLETLPLLVIFTTLILFGAARICTWVDWISLPWLEGWGEVYIWYFLPFEAFLILIGVFGIFWAAFDKIGVWKTVLSLCLIVAVAYLSLSLAIPGFKDILFWEGPNGERMEEYVHDDSGMFDMASLNVGADGHRIWLHNNPEAGDPSWAELEQFVRDDKTDKITYDYDTFVCADYAEMLHNNAEEAGIRAAYVFIQLGSVTNPVSGCSRILAISGRNGHACNAFHTTDRGLVFVDDTGVEGGSGEDCTVSLVKGEEYIPESIFFDSEWCPMGSVSDFGVFW